MSLYKVRLEMGAGGCLAGVEQSLHCVLHGSIRAGHASRSGVLTAISGFSTRIRLTEVEILPSM